MLVVNISGFFKSIAILIVPLWESTCKTKLVKAIHASQRTSMACHIWAVFKIFSSMKSEKVGDKFVSVIRLGVITN